MSAIVEIEAVGLGKVELYRGQLPGTADGIDHLHIDLRPVERRLTLDALVGDSAVVEHLGERRLRQLPDCIVPEVFRGVLRIAAAQLYLVLGEAESVVHHLRDIEAGTEFLLQRRLRAEDVRIVLGEHAHPKEAL